MAEVAPCIDQSRVVLDRLVRNKSTTATDLSNAQILLQNESSYLSRLQIAKLLKDTRSVNLPFKGHVNDNVREGETKSWGDDIRQRGRAEF
jgi:hypothetical protein